MPRLAAATNLGAIGHEECRLSCASDADCYCYAYVDGVCYSGLSRCACEAARTASECDEAVDGGFVVHKEMVRQERCRGLLVRVHACL